MKHNHQRDTGERCGENAAKPDGGGLYEEDNMEGGLKIGMMASLSKKITGHDLDVYAGIVGDCNPIHMQEMIHILYNAP